MQKTGKSVQIHSFNKIKNISEHLTDSIRKRKEEPKTADKHIVRNPVSKIKMSLFKNNGKQTINIQI